MESVRQSKVYFQRFNIVPLKNTASLQNKLADLRVRFSRTNAAVKRIDILSTAAF